MLNGSGSIFNNKRPPLRPSSQQLPNARFKILTFIIKDDSDDETIDTQDTRHDNGNDGLEDEVGLEDTHGADANT